MKLPHIKNVTECKYCGGNFGYFQKQFMSGWVRDNTLFEIGENGRREKYNSEMWDTINSGKYSSICYCMECEKPIGALPESDIHTI